MSLAQRLINYVNDIIDGVIPACQKHRWACERFLNDLSKIENEEYPYYFDIDEVDDFYQWASMFKHHQGVVAGQQILLTDFQLFNAANIYGWLRKKNNRRRFTKSYIQLARKNAKSQFLALMAGYETFITKERHSTFITGWTKDQSKEVFNELVLQIDSCEELKGKYSTSYGMVKHFRSKSTVIPLSKEARKTGDGKFPSLAIVDEFHNHDTSEIYDVLVSGMIGRKNPLISIITTAGFDLSKPCYREYNYVSSILDPDSPITNENYFVMICEMEKDDDIKDETKWVKANPIVCLTEDGIEQLRQELTTALDVPEKMRAFLTKNMNRWVDEKENGYMNMKKWNECINSEHHISHFEEKEVYIGVDLSAKEDITSVGIVGFWGGKYRIWHHSFMPEDKYREKMSKRDIPYDMYVSDNKLTIIPGAVVDQEFVENYIVNTVKEYKLKVKELCFDDWNATQFAKNMENKGYLIVAIPQGIKSLAEPTSEFRIQIYKDNVVLPKDNLLTWAVGNAIVISDANGNFKLDKKRSPEKIDPIAAVLNAFSRAMVNENKASVYEERDLFLL